MPRLRGFALQLVLCALGSTLPSPTHAASPSRDEGKVLVLPAEREADARELLAPVLAETPASLRWQGPSIEIDRVKWWLMRGERARAMVLLQPVATTDAQALSEATARSESFAIFVAWAPEVEATAEEAQLMNAAVEAIIARDTGDFYRVAVDNLHPDGRESEPDQMHYNATPPGDPAARKRAWRLELGASTLLVLLALGVTMRPSRDLPTEADAT